MQEPHVGLTGEPCIDKYGGTATGIHEKAFSTHPEEFQTNKIENRSQKSNCSQFGSRSGF